jgi:hypothetical protein
MRFSCSSWLWFDNKHGRLQRGFQSLLWSGWGNTIVWCGAGAVVNREIVQEKSCSEPGTYVHWDGIHI